MPADSVAGWLRFAGGESFWPGGISVCCEDKQRYKNASMLRILIKLLICFEVVGGEVFDEGVEGLGFLGSLVGGDGLEVG